ncbi:MAG: C1 family peptidase [Muribaculaceae bacterium]|nr:C1 family peptidase [Muribaculaceae bacterium]
MKKLAMTLAMGLACTAAASAMEADSVKTDSVEGFKFTDVKTVKTTSVKDQNRTGTCWCFAGTSFFEDEIMRQGGDSLDLSEMFTVRHCWSDKADRYVRLYGQTNFAPGGSLLDVAYVWKRYGAVPDEVYAGLDYGEEKHDHGELEGILNGIVKTVVKKPQKHITPSWRPAMEGVLDAYLGKLPEKFTYKGKEYTPKSFAASLPINPDDYVAYSSFTHHPFYEEFVLEVPDNWVSGRYMNVPLDELKAIVDNALENGYPVNWAADVSEKGFKWNKGVALMPKGKDEGDMTGTELSRWVKLSDAQKANKKYEFDGPVEEETITQELRQKWFDNQETTDDHGMEIVGIATDQNGKRYYKVKNSWDTNQVYDGFLYVSEPFLLAKTMGIVVHKDAVPKNIAKKTK